jgi:amino acid adenylation domain-containing protein
MYLNAPSDKILNMSASNTSLEVAAGLLVPQLVAERAQAAPKALALSAGLEAWTYAELERRSNQIAHHLRSLGVGRDALAGLAMQRSPEMIAVALGILKAGGAYLPLDPTTPAERLKFILEGADLSVLVIQPGFETQLTRGNWRVLDVEADRSVIDGAPSIPLAVPIAAEDLAYVIYTSGSTGLPKGVEITHGGLRNLVAWHVRNFEVAAADRAAHLAALGFDAAVWEVWPYLAAGASVHIAPEGVRSHPELLRDWLVAQKITITFAASALAERMLVIDWPGETALRILLTGADTLHRRPPANLPFKLVNNYGPTECTVVATSGMVAPASTGQQSPSIGTPIDNTEAFILDEQMKPVADGTVGELYIGGAGLARGYRKQPGLTAEKFVVNPWGKPGERLYRTGDLVRLLSDGSIEFRGRTDEQVKIRGYRVEPGEVTQVLNQHPAIAASAVVAGEDSDGGKRLLGYVVPREENITAGALRGFLLERLPDYMIPGVFVQVSALPVTAHGKVDRSALPAPDTGNTLADEAYIAPRTLVEERLGAILATLLRVERVGVNDNFFLLGGHSLLGTQLITNISRSFGVELSLLTLFDHPTVAAMAVEIERLVRNKIDAMSAEEVYAALSQPAVGRSA